MKVNENNKKGRKYVGRRYLNYQLVVNLLIKFWMNIIGRGGKREKRLAADLIESSII